MTARCLRKLWNWARDAFARLLAHQGGPGLSGGPCCGLEWFAEESLDHLVIKGRSRLCPPIYALRYRPAVRKALRPETPTAHLGFRRLARPGVTRPTRPL